MSLISEKSIVDSILASGAVTVHHEDPVRHASGHQAPIYVDLRVLLENAAARKLFVRKLAALMREHYPNAELISAVSPSGIPWGSWVAEHLELPLVYVRPRRKSHGTRNRIEGVVPAGARTVCIDDVVTTGRTLLESAEAIRKSGGLPIGALSIFTFGLARMQRAFIAANLPIYSITDLTKLVSVGSRTGYLPPETESRLMEWAQSPVLWKR